MSSTNLTITTLPSICLSPTILSNAATFFSTHYGIWGPHAPQPLKPGTRVKISAERLREMLVPRPEEGGETVYIIATTKNRNECEGKESEGGEEIMVGQVFATLYECKDKGIGRNVVWITQLVIHTSFRHRGIATSMLRSLLSQTQGKEGEKERCVGILSSHPFSIRAMMRVCSPSLGIVNKSEIEGIMEGCPVEYDRTAKLIENEEGEVRSANTGFWVDHQEPEESLRILSEEKGIEWEFGGLGEGCEFLCVRELEILGGQEGI